MKRTVIQLGGNTLVVALPAPWARKYHIRKGQEIHLEEQGSALMVRGKPGSTALHADFDTTKIGKFDKNYISYYYQSGFDDVTVYFNEAPVFQAVRDRVGQLLGFELVDQTTSSCVIKNILEQMESEFEIVMRKNFLLILEMSRELLAAMKNKDYSKIEEVRLLEKMNNRFTDFCKRVITKNKSSEDHPHFVYLIIWNLERLADEYKHMCDYLKREHPSIDEGLQEFFRKTDEQLRLFYEMFYKFDAKKAEAFLNRRRTLAEKGFQLMRVKKDKELVHYLMNVNATVSDMYGPYYCRRLLTNQ
ncbi:hypothetical protein J4464_06645 [Candidatus Woesearchaeota archaeon]|nr:hypothetical protein [Candidatus Woesearchaeota archaeon]